MTNKLLFELIVEFREAVEKVIAHLHGELGAGDFLLQVNTGQLARYGTLNTGEEYSFHGVGCRIAIDNFLVDFEFDVDGKTGGFDAWCLSLFAENYPERYADLLTHESIGLELEKALDLGEVFKPKTHRSRALYYISPEEPNLNALCPMTGLY